MCGCMEMRIPISIMEPLAETRGVQDLIRVPENLDCRFFFFLISRLSLRDEVFP